LTLFKIIQLYKAESFLRS